jgi:hypothetical protein
MLFPINSGKKYLMNNQIDPVAAPRKNMQSTCFSGLPLAISRKHFCSNNSPSHKKMTCESFVKM